jgi:hypothetical protein
LPHSEADHLITLGSPEDVVAKDHPLRKIKKLADEALSELSSVFDEMYAESAGRRRTRTTMAKVAATFGVRRQRDARVGDRSQGQARAQGAAAEQGSPLV